MTSLNIPAAVLKNTIHQKGSKTALGCALIDELDDGDAAVVSSDGVGIVIAYVYAKAGQSGLGRSVLIDPKFVREVPVTEDVVAEHSAEFGLVLLHEVSDGEDPRVKEVHGSEVTGAAFMFWRDQIPVIKGSTEKNALKGAFPLPTLYRVIAAMYAIEKREEVQTETAFRADPTVDIWMPKEVDKPIILETSRVAAIIPRAASVDQDTAPPQVRALRRDPTDEEREAHDEHKKAVEEEGKKAKKRKPAKKADRCGARHVDTEGHPDVKCDREKGHDEQHIAWVKEFNGDVMWEGQPDESPAGTLPAFEDDEK